MEKTMETTGFCSIIVTGPESTGKTTIATALAENFSGILVPEYARNYVEGLNRPYNYSDICKIAEWQYSQMKHYMREGADRLVIFDTYLIISKIWLLWFNGIYPEWIDNAIRESGNCLYLLCATDIEWEPDNVRENGGEARERLFREYQAELEKFKLNYRIVSGYGDKRISNALQFVDEYLMQYGNRK
jgi:nicotinamide riboside kinase